MTEIKTTPMAEYVDMLYTALKAEMYKRKESRWWIELRPNDESESARVVILLLRPGRAWSVSHEAPFHAVEQGMDVPLEEMTTVVKAHVREFLNAL